MKLGPLLAGIVGNRISPRSSYLFCAGVLVLCVGVQLGVVALRRRRIRLASPRPAPAT